MAGRAVRKNKWCRHEGDVADVVPQNFCDYCCGGVEYHGMHLIQESTGKQEYFVMLRQRGEKYASCVCKHDVIETSPGKYKFSTECTGRLASMYELKWEFPHTFCSKLHRYTLQQLQAVKSNIIERTEKTASGKDSVVVEIWLRGNKICTHVGQRERDGEIKVIRHCCVGHQEGSVNSTVL
jgi:hypothetical protein